jgi:hypothetical protein
MGFIPIFLTLGGFIMLFIIVVETSMKNKLKAFEEKFNQLKVSLSIQEPLDATKANLVHLESVYLKKDPTIRQESKASLAKAKLYLYQYNRLLMQKPYSFVARLTGRQAL